MLQKFAKLKIGIARAFADESNESIERSMFATDWAWWGFGALFSFFLGSILLTGPGGIFPDIQLPFTYVFDSVGYAIDIQRVIEGWVFENSRSGFPFGSSFYDYPASDFANLFLVKILGLVFGNWVAVINIYILLSFPVVFVSTYIVLRYLSLWRVLAFSGAIAYTFISFHVLRIPHLYYTWYFVVPIFFCISVNLAKNISVFYSPFKSKNRFYFSCLQMLILSSFGVYYALFGIITVAVGASAGYVLNRAWRPLVQGGLIVFLISLGVVLNVLPNKIYISSNGKNPDVAVRLPVESERYSLKLRQLLSPRIDHRNSDLANFTTKYVKEAPPSFYEWSSSLGIIGALGMIASGVIVFFSMVGKNVSYPIRFLSLLTWILFLFATVGGLGSLFAGIVSPLIRAWDRLAIFIGFGSIAIFYLVLQNKIEALVHKKYIGFVTVLVVVFSVFLSIFDQNVSYKNIEPNRAIEAFRLDKSFINRIENVLPPNSAVYQLPYIAFPESEGLHRMISCYEPATAFLHSSTLKWSYGGMKSRPGDLFYKSLARESIEKQLEVIKKLGFSGMYIDKRGFKDDAKLIISQLEILLNSPPNIVRDDGEVVFFRVTPDSNAQFGGMTFEQIIEKVGYRY